MPNAREFIERFLRDKYNLMFLGVILIAFIIRFYYFIQTYNQPLWWDEAEYMSMAKNILYGIPFDFNPQRPILFPLLISLFLWLGEGAVRFFISFLPSLGIVIVTYLLGREIYNKEVGLIASFIMAVFWSLLFDTTRIHADVLGLFFSLLGVYLFWNGYLIKKSVKLTSLGFLFMVLAFMVKVNMILTVLIVLIFLIITEKLEFLKEKILWKSVIWFFIPLIPFSIYNYLKFNTILPFIQGYVDPTSLVSKFQSSFNWSILNFAYVYTYKVFFVLFIGSYEQLKYNHELVKVKKNSYEPVKLAGLWIKEHSNKDDLILSKSVTQNTYYSERKTLGVPTDKEEIKGLKPKYLVISVFEMHTQELLESIEKIKDHLQIVNAYFFDAEGKQPVLVVYGFKDYDF